VRVQSGVTGADEQVAFLKEVASTQDALIKAEADIMESRLALSSLCSKESYEPINNYLKTLAAIPGADR
jgi:outer membrane protein TolC